MRLVRIIENLLQHACLLLHAQTAQADGNDITDAHELAAMRCVMRCVATNSDGQALSKIWRWTCVWLLALALAACVAPASAGKPDAASDMADARAQAVRLRVETTAGVMLWAVYPGKAPITAGNFLRHVDARAYDGASFYRTVRADNDRNPATIHVIQGGISRPDVANPRPAPFPPIAHESTADTGLRHVDGALSMARLAPGSAQSEFFVSIGENPVLDAGGTRNPDRLGFAVFGQVLQGMDVVRKIHVSSANAPTDEPYVQGQMLDAPVRIISIRRQSNPPNKSI